MEKFRKAKRLAVAFALVALIVPTMSLASADEHHVKMSLVAVGGSGVSGFAELTSLPNDGGTHIGVVARGLESGHEYVSLYYENHTCELEPYDPGDIIGGDNYTANGAGVGTTQGKVDDDLDEINSVSVRDAGTFTLLACADVHPGE